MYGIRLYSVTPIYVEQFYYAIRKSNKNENITHTKAKKKKKKKSTLIVMVRDGMLAGAMCNSSVECGAYQYVYLSCSVFNPIFVSIIKPIHVDSIEIAFIRSPLPFSRFSTISSLSSPCACVCDAQHFVQPICWKFV